MPRRLAVVLVSMAAAAAALTLDAPVWVYWPLIAVVFASEAWWTVGMARRMQADERAGGSR